MPFLRLPDRRGGRMPRAELERELREARATIEAHRLVIECLTAGMDAYSDMVAEREAEITRLRRRIEVVA